MNFFQEQENARKKSSQLIVLFTCAVILTVLAIDFALIIAYKFYSLRSNDPSNLLNEPLLSINDFTSEGSLTAIFILTSTILMASITKKMQLNKGGSIVAKSLGGIEISGSSSNLNEQRYINVVEEMSIASGTPMPRIFVMEDENAINAFAAGHSINDAAVCVSKGALNKLTRDELQGVIAHEFSHIFNGDMSLNIKIMGWIHGILILATAGKSILRHSSRSSSRSSRSGSGNGIITVFGLILLVIGYIGVIVSRIIKAAISREREYLADASSVQYTRNPGGIGGALKKILVSNGGSQIAHPNAESASHLFFSDAIYKLQRSAFSTHPPLPTRLKAIFPNFNYERFVNQESSEIINKLRNQVDIQKSKSESKPQKPKKDDSFIKESILIGTVINSIGKPNHLHKEYSKLELNQIPTEVKKLCHNPNYAPFVIYSLFHNQQSEEIKKKQKEEVAKAPPSVLAAEAKLENLSRDLYLPILEITIPSLLRLSSSDQKELILHLKKIILLDKKVANFEFVFYSILKFSLGLGGKQQHKNISIRKSYREINVLLSFLAHQGTTEEEAARNHFNQGIEILNMRNINMYRIIEIDLNVVSNALSKLIGLNFLDKEKLLKACCTIVLADDHIKIEEKETLRAVSAALGCPMPPIV